jgi:hypothetical protein
LAFIASLRLSHVSGNSPSCETCAFGDGQDKDPLPLVDRANFRRAENAPRRSVTQSAQVFDNVGQPQRDMSLDVFKETGTWSHCSNSGCDKWPEVPWVFSAKSLAGCTEWLARVAAREDVHQSVKLSPRESLEIAPDRCVVQESRFSLCSQVRCGEGFDLDKSDCAKAAANCSLEAEVNAPVTAAKADVIDGVRIHMAHAPSSSPSSYGS